MEMAAAQVRRGEVSRVAPSEKGGKSAVQEMSGGRSEPPLRFLADPADCAATLNFGRLYYRFIC
jgi:hypothetical protein